MEIVPSTYYNNLKRYWRRRKYQRLSVDNKKKLRVTRLGGGPNGTSPPRFWKIRTMRKLKLRFLTPIKLLTKFHEAYVDMMIQVAGNVGSVGRFTGKKVAKTQDQMYIASSGGEEVDSRLVLEIYKRLAASRQLAAYLLQPTSASN